MTCKSFVVLTCSPGRNAVFVSSARVMINLLPLHVGYMTQFLPDEMFALLYKSNVVCVGYGVL